jgi:hypothetical protein
VRAAALALLALLATGCSSYPLGDPHTAMLRLKELESEGDTKSVAGLGESMTKSTEVPSADRAEAAFLAAEAERARGRLGVAFDRYRWVLENAPWSEHAAIIEARLFEIGPTMLFGEEYSGWFDDRARGVEVLETLAAHFRASDKADDALKMVGDYFADEDVAAWGDASVAYLRVADEYPGSEWAERCLWLAGHCRLIDSQGPVYDRNELLHARDLLERSIARHPRGVAVKEARADLAQCREELARCELSVADFYAGRGVVSGEQLRLANAALLYPDTPGGKEALARLAAEGLDPAAIGKDPRASSVDAIRYRAPRWEREAGRKTPAMLPAGVAR